MSAQPASAGQPPAIVFRAAPLDMRVLLATVMVIVAVSLAAVMRPCRRAASVDPAVALRAD